MAEREMERDSMAEICLTSVQFAANLLFTSSEKCYTISDTSDSDDDLECLIWTRPKKPREKYREKVKDYVAEVVPRYSLEDFRKHFRLHRSTVEHLTQLIGVHLDDDHRMHPGSRKTSGSINILLPIWALSNQESFRSLSDRFGVGNGHAYRIFYQFCKVLTSKVKEFVCWPQGRDFEDVLVGFETLRENSFPGVVGCVDGSYIPIRGLQAENDSYCTRKKFRAVTLQAVCDHNKRFIDIYAGWPGGAHDARVWRNSPLCQKLESSREIYLPSDTHILGDSAYPISETLLVPYKDNGFMTQKQKHFNKVLSSSRVVIENAFALLKSRFRRLRYLDMINMDFATTVITTACILHNICIDQDDVLEDVENDEDLVDLLETGTRSAAGDQKRNRIADHLFANR